MSKKPYFSPVEVKVDFPTLEKEINSYWQKKAVVAKYLKRNYSSKKIFSFLDGPITANNPMAVHHAWGRTYKDIFQRFKNMQGYKQRFQNGFDCQGLWVEVEVEKELGLKSKKDIENLIPGKTTASIAKFVDLCKARAKKFADIQTKQSQRLGYFMDWDNSYYTLSDDNNYMIWHFLQVCFANGYIYKGRDSVPWCPRCGTAISQHEILTEDYQKTTHESVYLRYPVRGEAKTYLLVWTTTPWTLPGNVVVSVDAKQAYVAAEDSQGNTYYLLEPAAQKLKLKVVKKVPGEKLVGLTYDSPFDGLPRVKKALENFTHHVVATDSLILPVSAEEGTGLIHTAPGQGTEDFQLGKKLDLPVIELINESADYLDGMEGFSGQNAKKHPEIILEYLSSQGNYLFKTERITHRYPACWRCKTELVWRVVDEWYIAMDKVEKAKFKNQASTVQNPQPEGQTLRQKMIQVTKSIQWLPDFGLERELDWLANMHDWLISKKRYWGLALPIWECPRCARFEVIGSFQQLKDRAVEGWKKFEGHSPHKPWIDEVKIKCLHCGETISRIPDVGNPWLDAGIVPFSTITRKNQGPLLYQENRQEWEKWFPADFITESFPGQFKNWFYSLIAMSAVLENTAPFRTVLGFATLLGEDGRPMHKSWGNAIGFDEGADKIGVDVMRLLFTRQNPADNLLFGYRLADEMRRKFHLKLWNVFNFFVTYANLDGFKPVKNTNLGSNLDNILDKWILVRLNELTRAVTTALNQYDAYTAAAVLEKFVDDLSNWYIRRSRDRVGPWAESDADKLQFYRMTYSVLLTLSQLLAPFTPYLAEFIFRSLKKSVSVHLTDWPQFNAKLLNQNQELISEMDRVRNLVEKIHSARKTAGISTRQPLNSFASTEEQPAVAGLTELIQDETNLKQIFWRKKEDQLDITLSPLLIEEAKTRQLIRQIQEERKAQGLTLTQKCLVYSDWLPKEENLLTRIKQKTLSSQLLPGDKLKVVAEK